MAEFLNWKWLNAHDVTDVILDMIGRYLSIIIGVRGLEYLRCDGDMLLYDGRPAGRCGRSLDFGDV